MDLRSFIRSPGLAVAAFILAAPAWALSSGETRFIKKAAGDSVAEVELARLAQDKAMHEEVLQFASRMREDHENALAELRTMAAAKGVELPAQPDKKHERDMRKLTKLSGPEFEREYMKRMVADHEKALKEFEKQAKSAKDPQVRDFAESTRLTILAHLRAAQATRDIAMSGERTAMRNTGSTRR